MIARDRDHNVRARALIGMLLLVQAASSCLSRHAFAQALDSGAAVHLDQIQVTIEARGTTRRQLLQRLFTEAETRVEWIDKSLAEEVVHGTFTGRRSQIARRLLAATNFVLVYEGGP